jgi:hypothetical protein
MRYFFMQNHRLHSFTSYVYHCLTQHTTARRYSESYQQTDQSDRQSRQYSLYHRDCFLWKLFLCTSVFMWFSLSVSAQAPLYQWQAPTLCSPLNSSADDYAPAYLARTRSLYFTSESQQTARIYRVVLDSLGMLNSEQVNRIGNPESVVIGNAPTTASQSYMRFHPNMTPALFSAHQATRSGAQLHTFSVGVIGGTAFGKPEPLSWLNTSAFTAHTTYSPSGNLLAFSSNRTDMPNAGGCDIYIAEFLQGTWRITTLNTQLSHGGTSGPNGERDEITPCFATDSILFFASNSHTDSTTDFNIYYTVRSDNGKWSNPIPVESLNSPSDDTDPCLLPNGAMLFASNRIGGKGGFDLYYARPGSAVSALPSQQVQTLAVPDISARIYPERLTLRRSTLIEAFPLLPTIFFEDRSARLPAYLSTLTMADATLYDPDRIRAESLTAYFEVLNIIGKRLQFYRTATIEIVGSAVSSETSPTRSAKDVARERAETLRTYFSTVWNISDDRMTIRSTVVEPPINAPLTAIEELRTAHIRTTSQSLLAPIRMSLEQITPSADTITIQLKKNNAVPHSRWSLEARVQSMVFVTNSGNVLPFTEHIPIAKYLDILRQSDEISVRGSIVSADNPDMTIPFLTTAGIDRTSLQRDTIRQYAFLLTNNDRPLTDDIRASLTALAKTIRTGSTISLRVTTDALTPADQASTRTTEQAQMIEKILRDALKESIRTQVTFQTRGMGRTIRYDNTQPFGRHYSRLATIFIE